MQITLKGYECRCGHRWAPRKAQTPIVCPKCKSPYWNIGERRKSQEIKTKGGN